MFFRKRGKGFEIRIFMEFWGKKEVIVVGIVKGNIVVKRNVRGGWLIFVGLILGSLES